jgi:hypothetical protein
MTEIVEFLRSYWLLLGRRDKKARSTHSGQSDNAMSFSVKSCRPTQIPDHHQSGKSASAPSPTAQKLPIKWRISVSIRAWCGSSLGPEMFCNFWKDGTSR